MMGNPHSCICGETMVGHLARLELSLREANHRVANSLQLASAVVGRNARATVDADARSRLEATRLHIEAIAGIHVLLSSAGPSGTVSLRDYLANLVNGLRETVRDEAGARTITLRCDASRVIPEYAVCFGMIVNELVGNACKYAYRHDEAGDVRISFRTSDRGFILAVEDDGRGFDTRAGAEGTGPGTQMIEAMARQIGADFRYDDPPTGTRALVRGALRSSSARPAVGGRRVAEN